MKNSRSINMIVIHHTGSRILGRFDHPALIRARNKLRGFDDNDYHYLIGNGALTKDGRIYTGREEENKGAHTSGHNEHSIGIALIGNCDRKKPTEKQWERLVELVTGLCMGHGINPERIYGHRELCTNTVCPGRYVNMDALRAEADDSIKTWISYFKE